jgi:hypothetical protein
MAKEQDDGRDMEVDFLRDGIGVDPEKIAEQITKKRGGGTPAGEKKDDKKPDDKPADKKDEKQKEDKKEVPNPDAIRAAMLNEMFGEQFKTVEDFKKANIPGQLQELVNLRQKNQELETQVKAKPKHHYANDDIAKLDEFTRTTGIKDVGVFNKINVADLANMQPMDALVLNHIIENPSLAGKEQQVRRYFEKKYDVDPKQVEAGELTQEDLETNLIGLTSDGERAKTKLQELKGKIKMPEIIPDEKQEKVTKWTPEIEKEQTADWTKVNDSMVAEFAKISIPMEGSEEPIINFALPEETKTVILKNALDYAISNQMEINKANVTSIAKALYSEAILTNQGKIARAIFERARTVTEEEYLKKYHGATSKNDDKPPVQTEELTEEAKKEKAFQAEYNR